MLRFALMFFIIALVAAMFGFGGVAGLSAGIGKTILQVFVALIVIGLLFGVFAGNRFFAR